MLNKWRAKRALKLRMKLRVWEKVSHELDYMPIMPAMCQIMDAERASRIIPKLEKKIFRLELKIHNSLEQGSKND